MKILIRKINTFFSFVKRENKVFKSHYNNFGLKIALLEYLDGIFPPGKRAYYIQTIERYVDNFLKDLVDEYNEIDVEEFKRKKDQEKNLLDKYPIWCCWWQGEDSMPELVKMCHQRLKDIIPENAELHLITLDNYLNYVDMPKHIIEKFNNNTITMTTMSDILRHCLMSKYGGYWLDATVFFTGDIPKEYFERDFYCQKMYDEVKCKREACKGRWCGFSMAGNKNNILFSFMRDAFFKWWEVYDDIPDYVLIDYILLTGYKYIPAIKKTIDSVENNNEDIFYMYGLLNRPYTDELYKDITKNNVMHKLTYKIDLYKRTNMNEETLYLHLLNEVLGDQNNE